jgi:hypothetical protein
MVKWSFTKESFFIKNKMGTYREIVDDLQVEAKSHNESIKTQNPYWILFRFLSEINSIRDELLRQIKSKFDVPVWMIKISPPQYGQLSNSGGISGIYDEYKFSVYTIPSAFYSTLDIEILDIVPVMVQKKVYLESSETVIRRIRGNDENLSEYHYGFRVDDKLFIYPFLSKAYIYYIPKVFCGSYDSVVVTDEIPAPDFVVSEARKRVWESIINQKNIPEDDRPDQEDKVLQQKQQ